MSHPIAAGFDAVLKQEVQLSILDPRATDGLAPNIGCDHPPRHRFAIAVQFEAVNNHGPAITPGTVPAGGVTTWLARAYDVVTFWWGARQFGLAIFQFAGERHND